MWYAVIFDPPSSFGGTHSRVTKSFPISLAVMLFGESGGAGETEVNRCYKGVYTLDNTALTPNSRSVFRAGVSLNIHSFIL